MLVATYPEVSEEDSFNGYRHLLRAEEIWLLARRKQAWSNWFTKLSLDPTRSLHVGPRSRCYCSMLPRQSGNGLELASAWAVDVAQHFLRKTSYKGNRSHVLKDRLRVTFDGCTLPAAFFTDFGLQLFGGLGLMPNWPQARHTLR